MVLVVVVLAPPAPTVAVAVAVVVVGPTEVLDVPDTTVEPVEPVLPDVVVVQPMAGQGLPAGTHNPQAGLQHAKPGLQVVKPQGSPFVPPVPGPVVEPVPAALPSPWSSRGPSCVLLPHAESEIRRARPKRPRTASMPSLYHSW